MSTSDQSTVNADEAFEELAGIALSEDSLHSVLQTVADPTSKVLPGDIYAREAAAFTEDSRRNAERFARFAGVAVSNMHAYESARVGRQPAGRPGARAVIDQAKGVLIDLTADEAFILPAQAPMATNQKLRDIADRLVRTGELPRTPRRSYRPSQGRRKSPDGRSPGQFLFISGACGWGLWGAGGLIVAVGVEGEVAEQLSGGGR